jgi:hypothetical protein
MSTYIRYGMMVLFSTIVCGCSNMNGVVTGQAVTGAYSSAQASGSSRTGFESQYRAPAALAANSESSKAQLTVNAAIWSALSEAEKDQIKHKYEVDITDRDQYGLIVDVQGSNESTAGTNTGAALGQAYGSAMYIDRAFQGTPTYSATNHVSAALVGAIIGSSLDKPPESKFHFMYTIKDMTGNIIQREQLTGQPFHQSIGMCVSLPNIAPVSRSLCENNLEVFKKTYTSFK